MIWQQRQLCLNLRKKRVSVTLGVWLFLLSCANFVFVTCLVSQLRPLSNVPGAGAVTRTLRRSFLSLTILLVRSDRRLQDIKARSVSVVTIQMRISSNSMFAKLNLEQTQRPPNSTCTCHVSIHECFREFNIYRRSMRHIKQCMSDTEKFNHQSPGWNQLEPKTRIFAKIVVRHCWHYNVFSFIQSPELELTNTSRLKTTFNGISSRSGSYTTFEKILMCYECKLMLV